MGELIGLWRLDKGSGLVAFDDSGYGNNGGLEGTNPTWVDGKSKKAINLPGSNERINCGKSSPLDQIGNGSFWFSFWMKSKDETPLNYGVLLSKFDNSSNRLELITVATTNRLVAIFRKLGLGPDGAIYFSVDTQPFDTNWNNIIFVINRTTDKMILYMNTIKDSVEIDLSTLPIDASNAGNLCWGARYNGIIPYEGLFDEIRVYTGIPTQEEIDFLFENPSGIPLGKITPWLVGSRLAGVPEIGAAKMIPPSIISVVKDAGEPIIEKIDRPLVPTIEDIKGPF